MPQRPADVDVVQSIKDIIFAKNEYQLIDKYVIQDGRKHPFAILCPGGGYYMVCSFIEGVPIAKKLNQMGISAFIVYYRVKKKALYPAPQDDLARAVKEAFAKTEQYNLDTDNYSIWGASAGGHLAASFGTENMGYQKYGVPKPGALILSYPVVSMDRKLTHMQTHDLLLGENAAKGQEEFASVEKNVSKNYPPTYIWCGDADDVVPPENTKLLAEALETFHIPCNCEIFSGVGHGIGPATGTAAEGWIDHAVKFWRER